MFHRSFRKLMFAVRVLVSALALLAATLAGWAYLT